MLNTFMLDAIQAMFSTSSEPENQCLNVCS